MSDVTAPIDALRMWTRRHWVTAGAVAVGTLLVVGIPTDLIDTPLFGRMIPPSWWAWPALLVSSVLAGLLGATYVAIPDPAVGSSSQDAATDPSHDPLGGPEDRAATRSGYVGGVLTYFAVGCPVCNKLVLLALGASGAVTWFEPLQPILQLVAVGLLGWALVRRLSAQQSCPVPVGSGRA